MSVDAVPEDWERGLAIVAHPDDLEYGASADVSTWTRRGVEVAYLLLTSGEAGMQTPPEEVGPLRAAEFAFPAGAPLSEVLRILREERPVQRRLTIPEGLKSADGTRTLGNPVTLVTEQMPKFTFVGFDFGGNTLDLYFRILIC